MANTFLDPTLPAGRARQDGLTTMTLDEARAQAVTDARRTGRPQQVWQHTGGETPTGYISSRGTFLARDATTRAPRFCWTLVETHDFLRLDEVAD